MPTGDLIVDSLRAQASAGAAVGKLAQSTAKAINAVASVVESEIAHRQTIEQATSVLLQRAGIQSIEPAPNAIGIKIKSVDVVKASASVAIAQGTVHG